MGTRLSQLLLLSLLENCDFGQVVDLFQAVSPSHNAWNTESACKLLAATITITIFIIIIIISIHIAVVFVLHTLPTPVFHPNIKLKILNLIFL